MRYELKTPYRDGTTHVIFEPLDFMARLAALAPKALADARGAGSAQAQSEPHKIPRRLCAEQQVSDDHHPGQTGQGGKEERRQRTG